jgi:hypothetical protein
MDTHYIEVVPNITVNINKLLFEFEHFKNYVGDVDNHGNLVLVQRKCHIIIKDKLHENIDLNDTPYTKSLIDKFKEIVSFNSVTYRFVMPNTCYNWHTDTGKLCLHIPLITNPGCWFVYERRSFSMPADGSVYLVNNSKPHTFTNAGDKPRLHLTFENL